MSINDYLLENNIDETNETKLKAQARSQILGAFVDSGIGYHSANRKQDSKRIQQSNQAQNLRCRGGNTMYLTSPN